MKELELIKSYGATNIEGYCLVNNYGYTFDLDGGHYDARYWANCYGCALDEWQIHGRGNRTEKIIELEKALNAL